MGGYVLPFWAHLRFITLPFSKHGHFSFLLSPFFLLPPCSYTSSLSLCLFSPSLLLPLSWTNPHVLLPSLRSTFSPHSSSLDLFILPSPPFSSCRLFFPPAPVSPLLSLFLETNPFSQGLFHWEPSVPYTLLLLWARGGEVRAASLLPLKYVPVLSPHPSFCMLVA